MNQRHYEMLLRAYSRPRPARHKHSEACCNDCGQHPLGTCQGCDHRRLREALNAKERHSLMR